VTAPPAPAGFAPPDPVVIAPEPDPVIEPPDWFAPGEPAPDAGPASLPEHATIAAESAADASREPRDFASAMDASASAPFSKTRRAGGGQGDPLY
jgi:hypothetical protein